MAKALGKKELLHWASEETGMPVLSLENLKTGAVLHEVILKFCAYQRPTWPTLTNTHNSMCYQQVFAVAFPRAVHVRRLQLCQVRHLGQPLGLS